MLLAPVTLLLVGQVTAAAQENQFRTPGAAARHVRRCREVATGQRGQRAPPTHSPQSVRQCCAPGCARLSPYASQRCSVRGLIFWPCVPSASASCKALTSGVPWPVGLWLVGAVACGCHILKVILRGSAPHPGRCFVKFHWSFCSAAVWREAPVAVSDLCPVSTDTKGSYWSQVTAELSPVCSPNTVLTVDTPCCLGRACWTLPSPLRDPQDHLNLVLGVWGAQKIGELGPLLQPCSTPRARRGALTPCGSGQGPGHCRARGGAPRCSQGLWEKRQLEDTRMMGMAVACWESSTDSHPPLT